MLTCFGTETDIDCLLLAVRTPGSPAPRSLCADPAGSPAQPRKPSKGLSVREQAKGRTR